MRLSYLSLAIGSVCVPALAQDITATGKTLTPLAVIAKSGAQSAHDAVAKDTPFAPRRGLRASTRLQPPGMWSSASTLVQSSSFVPMVTISERLGCRGNTGDGAGTSASASSQGAKLGPHSVLVTFRGKPGTKGVLRLSFRSNVQYGTTASRNEASVDVGNDNKVDWQIGGAGKQGGIKEIDVALDTNGELVVRMTTRSNVAGTGDLRDFVNCYSDLTAWFKSAEQGKCEVASYGTGCGPKLDAGIADIGGNQVVVWGLSGGFKNAFAVQLIGSQAIKLDLGGGCSLLTNALVISLIKTDENGAWKDSQILPRRNVTSYHQMLPIDLVNGQLVLKASNGQRLNCTGF